MLCWIRPCFRFVLFRVAPESCNCASQPISSGSCPTRCRVSACVAFWLITVLLDSSNFHLKFRLAGSRCSHDCCSAGISIKGLKILRIFDCQRCLVLVKFPAYLLPRLINSTISASRIEFPYPFRSDLHSGRHRYLGFKPYLSDNARWLAKR